MPVQTSHTIQPSWEKHGATLPWSPSTIVKENGKLVKNEVKGEDGYLELERKWKKGDVIDVDFAMECVLIPAPHGSNRDGDNFQVLKWGPLIRARDEKIDPDYDKPMEFIIRKEGTDGAQKSIIDIRRTEPTLKATRMEFIVPTTKGNIRMVDYSSVDCWEGIHIQT